MHRFVALLLASLSLAATVPPAQFTDPDRVVKMSQALRLIERMFTTFVEQQHMPGASMAIIVDGNVIWLKTAGFRDVAAKSPVADNTLFRIASMTKSFTAMAILKLRDEGKLSLDEPVSHYVPELANLAPATKDAPVLTIRHLLTHSEGFPEDNPWGDRQLARSDATLSSWMRAGIPFSTVPGTAYEYSNYGFAILGQIVQRVSTRPYAEYVREKILVPLGMTDTVFDVRDVPADRIALGYRWEDETWKPEPALPHGSFGAMGGLWTTPADLAKYIAFHLAAWPPRDDDETGPIRRSSAREMQQAWRAASASVTRPSVDARLALTNAAYGYGLRVSSDCRFRHMVGHGGGLPGYGSLEAWLPEYGVGLIAFGNVTYAGFTPLFNQVFDVLNATGGLQRRVPQPSAALLKAKDDVSRLLNQWDTAFATEITASNFFLDQIADRRAKEFGELAARHGKCVARPFYEVENALRGKWKMDCERGSLDVAITMAPTMPPKVQVIAPVSILPPDATMSKAIDTSIALIGKWDDELAKSLAVEPYRVQRLADAVRAQWGACVRGEVLFGDGAKVSVVELLCTNGKVWERLVLDPDSHKAKEIFMVPSRENPCVP